MNGIINLLEKLLEVTTKGIMKWTIDESGEDVFIGKLDDTIFKIEIIYLSGLDNSVGSERSLVRIYNSKLYETFAIGTRGYELILEMLDQNIFGWKEARKSQEKKIAALTKILNEKLANNP